MRACILYLPPLPPPPPPPLPPPTPPRPPPPPSIPKKDFWGATLPQVKRLSGLPNS